MLENAKSSGYEFISFEKARKLTDNNLTKNGTCILRHDVDVNINFALKMAEVESSLGIYSTYFFMWRSPFYNLSSRNSQDCVEKIIDLGHDIALHYDQGYDTLKNYSTLRSIKEINRQAIWMEELFCCKIKSVSFHQPSKTLLTNGIDTFPRLNTYEKRLKSKWNIAASFN